MNPSRFSPLLLLAGAPAWLYSHPTNAEAAPRWAMAERQRQAQNWPAARAGYAQLVALGLGVGWRGLGLLRELGDPERDWARARDGYERARAAGDDCGHWLIGNLHRRGGPGPIPDGNEARRWYERGLAAGHGDNGFFLGLLYEAGGPGRPADWARARKSTVTSPPSMNRAGRTCPGIQTGPATTAAAPPG